MKALSLKQPWANMIAEGLKTIETRTWSTPYRGPLLIVSSKTPDLRALAGSPASKFGPYGCAIAVATLVDCRPMDPGDEDDAKCAWYEGAMAWVLKDVVRVKPFPVRGRLGVYDVAVPEGGLVKLPWA